MWSYYGTKLKHAPNYPKPHFDMIVEPFCGAAQYSLHENNWKKDVYLLDKYPIIIAVWEYLISATPKDILGLPDLQPGDSLNNYTQLSDSEKWLMGFCINPASSSPKKKVMERSRWSKDRVRISENIHKIKHWKVKTGSYEDMKNPKATWYIDPPYEVGGKYYNKSNKDIDYNHLSAWCKSRKGQVIVCENTKATWMNFEPLIDLQGQLHKTTEAIWYRENNSG